MEYLRQIEEDLKIFGDETKKKYPEVKSSSDKALLSLKSMRETYVSQRMNKNKSQSEDSFKLPQSSDLLEPYLLVCNYSDSNSKFVLSALSGIQMLLSYDFVPNSDYRDIFRVLKIQSGSSKSDILLKILQIILQISNILIQNTNKDEQIDEAIMHSILSIIFSLSDIKSHHSVNSTALSAAKQILSQYLNHLSSTLNEYNFNDESLDESILFEIPSIKILGNIIRDFACFLQNKNGEWIKNVVVQKSLVLDILNEILNNFQLLFDKLAQFRSMVKDLITPSIKFLLKNLQDDYVLNSIKYNPSYSVSLAAKSIKLVRTIILKFSTPYFYSELEFIISLLVHTLFPNRVGFTEVIDEYVNQIHNSNVSSHQNAHSIPSNSNASNLNNKSSTYEHHESDSSFRSRLEEASSSLLSGNFMSKIGLPLSINLSSSSSSTKHANTLYPGNPITSAPNLRSNLSNIMNIEGFFMSINGNLKAAQTKSPRSTLSISTSSMILQLPSHPASLCLEALLSLILKRGLSLAADEKGMKILEYLFANLSLCTSSILIGSMSNRSKYLSEFEDLFSGSPNLQILKKYISGEMNEELGSQEDSVTSALNEIVVSLNGSKAKEVMMLCYFTLQVLIRFMLKLAIQIDFFGSKNKNQHEYSIFLPQSILMFTPLDPAINASFSSDSSIESLKSSLVNILESSYEPVLDTCSIILNSFETSSIIRSSFGVVSELALLSGIIDSPKICEIVISLLCQNTVPLWHGPELVEAQPDSGKDQTQTAYSKNLEDSIKWRHLYACIKLMQVIHLISNKISDWDNIVDAFEQLIHFFTRSQKFRSSHILQINKINYNKEISMVEVQKLFSAIDRFKRFTVFLSNNSMIKLITSLVALSMNNLAIFATSHLENESDNRKDDPSDRQPLPFYFPSLDDKKERTILSASEEPIYIAEAVNNNILSFSLLSIIQIVKYNAFRIAVFWQIVNSHLRMIASMKDKKCHSFAVSATFDIIFSAIKCHQTVPLNPISWANLHFLADENLSEMQSLQQNNSKKRSSSMTILSDEILLNLILPSFESLFIGRDVNRYLLMEKSEFSSRNPKLSYNDLLTSLKSLALIKFSDIKYYTVLGIFYILQSNEQNIFKDSFDAWPVILEVLSSVPYSWTEADLLTHDSSLDGKKSPQSEEDLPFPSPSSSSGKWPKESLNVAFDSMKIIIDEYLEILVNEEEIVQLILSAISYFCSQTCDVNISLTSIEMLWKVTDFVISTNSTKVQYDATTSSTLSAPKKDSQNDKILKNMLNCLLTLSMDSRPEVRHCSMNTLFTTMATHALIISSDQWRVLFENIIFPLFVKTEERTKLAMWKNEEAIAPELKKGVKMSIHHSRDTAYKQWSETRVLTLRGLARVLKSCTKLLMGDKWFRNTWTTAIDVCLGTLHSAEDELEVSLAGLDVLFAMIHIIIQIDERSVLVIDEILGDDDVVEVVEDDILPQMKVRDDKKSQSNVSIESETELKKPSKSKPTNFQTYYSELWKLTWKAIHDSVYFNCNSSELSLAIARKLSEFYHLRDKFEFRYSENIRTLLESLVVLVRIRLPASAFDDENVTALEGDAEATSPQTSSALSPACHPSNDRRKRSDEMQLQRCVMELLHSINAKDTFFRSMIVSSLSEICFGIFWTSISSPISLPNSFDPHSLLLMEVPASIRDEAGKMLSSLITIENNYALQLDIVINRFIVNLLVMPFKLRLKNLLTSSFHIDNQYGNELVRSELFQSVFKFEHLDLNEKVSERATLFRAIDHMSLSHPEHRNKSAAYLFDQFCSFSQSLDHKETSPQYAFEILSDNLCTFFDITGPMEILFGLIQSLSTDIVTQSKYYETKNDISTLIILSLTYTLSMWSQNEIKLKPSRSSSTSSRVISQLFELVDIYFDDRTSSEYILLLVESLVSSLSQAIYSTSAEIQQSEKPFQADLHIQFSLWQRSIRLLNRFADNNSKLSETIKKRSLWSLIEVFNLNIHVLLSFPRIREFPIFKELDEMCSCLVGFFIGVKAPEMLLFDESILGNFLSLRKLQSDNAIQPYLVYSWCYTALKVFPHNSTFSSTTQNKSTALNQSPRQKLKDETKNASISVQDLLVSGSHIPILIPPLSEYLCLTQSSDARKNTLKLLEDQRMVQQSKILNDLVNLNSELNNKIEYLETELNKVKSAAALPF